MPLDALLAQLSTVAPFSSASASTRAELAAAFERQPVGASDVAFREGDPAPTLFVVAAGAFDVLKRAEDGAEMVVRTLDVGEVGGLTNLTGGAPRSATLRARTAAEVVTLDKALFLRAMRADEGLNRAVLETLGGKVRAKNTRIATLLAHTRRDPRERVIFFDAKPYEREAFERRLAGADGDLRVSWVDARLGPDTAALAEGYPVVCAFVNDDLGRPVLEALAARGVRLVAMRCAGTNNVDLPAASELGLTVVNVPAYSPHAVAEHTVALLLTLVRRTHRAFARVREGNFSLAGLVGFDLNGKTAGIVGTGRIGAIVARILGGFGMQVLAHDAAEDAALASSGVPYVPLDELFATSDVVSLHVPLLPATYHLVDGARLARAKRGLVLLNTSRGGLVDAGALVEALKSGQVGAAGLDVYEEEAAYFFQDGSDRAVDDDLLARLMTFPNVLITSHQGFLTREALDAIAAATIESALDFLAGRPLSRRVPVRSS